MSSSIFEYAIQVAESFFLDGLDASRHEFITRLRDKFANAPSPISASQVSIALQRRPAIHDEVFSDLDPATLFVNKMHTIEVRFRLADLLQGRFGVHRMFYVHIPKTAGTTLIESLDQSDSYGVWRIDALSEDLLGQFVKCVGKLNRGAKLFVTGHVHFLHFCVNTDISESDVFVCSLRDPREIHLSNVEYMQREISDFLKNERTPEEVEDWRLAYTEGRYPEHLTSRRDIVASWLAMSDLNFENSKHWCLSVLRSEPYYQVYGNIIFRYLRVGDRGIEGTMRFWKQYPAIWLSIEDVGSFLSESLGERTFASHKVSSGRRLSASDEDLSDPQIQRLWDSDEGLYSQLLTLVKRGLTWSL